MAGGGGGFAAGAAAIGCETWTLPPSGTAVGAPGDATDTVVAIGMPATTGAVAAIFARYCSEIAASCGVTSIWCVRTTPNTCHCARQTHSAPLHARKDAKRT